MDFKISITKHAEQDVNQAIDFYLNVVKSPIAAENFYKEVIDTLLSLSINPFYRFYNSFRGKPLKNFPFIVFLMLMKKKEL